MKIFEILKQKSDKTQKNYPLILVYLLSVWNLKIYYLFMNLILVFNSKKWYFCRY